MIIKDTVEPKWSDATYREYDKLIEAINNFTNATMPARNIRVAGDSDYLLEQMLKLNEAVVKFDDWLFENEGWDD